MRFVKFALLAVVAFLVGGSVLFTLAQIAMEIPASRPTEVTGSKPFADFIGREYRVAGNVSALAWNDFPRKDVIVAISLMSPPLVQNRFVSYQKRLSVDQMVRIVSAWRQVTLTGSSYSYRVALSGSGLPEGVPIEMTINSDGVPDPRVYDLISRSSPKR